MLEDPFSEAGKEVILTAAKELTKLVYNDVKHYLVSLGKSIKKPFRKVGIKKFNAPAELRQALQKHEIKDGDWIKIKCIPSPFGPYLRTHFLMPFIGHHTNLRLGPPLLSPNPILGMMAQATSHLIPVGLYPSIDMNTQQACLYPIEGNVCGFIGILPGIRDLVTYTPALLATRHTMVFGVPCWITGIIRYVGASVFGVANLSPEDHEVVRQLGNVWFLDATDDESSCEPLEDAEPVELWGGIYASGHLEIKSGTLPIKSVIDIFSDSMKEAGFEPHVSQNQARRKEIGIYAQGLRALVDSQYPFFSVHMDAELSRDFGGYRTRFDKITDEILKGIQNECVSESVQLVNDFDLDFSYADSTQAYSVMKSLGADSIKDPLAMAIRDWHRTRGS